MNPILLFLSWTITTNFLLVIRLTPITLSHAQFVHSMLNCFFLSSQVEHVTFLLVLCTRPPQMAVTPTSSDASYHSANVLSDAGLALPDIGSSPVHDQNQNKKQDRYVGKVALGCSVRGEEQRQHWIAIIASPRKVVSQWHALK